MKSKVIMLLLFANFLLVSQVLKGNSLPVSVTTVDENKKKIPVENALVVIYDKKRHNIIESAKTDKEGICKLGINTKARYDLVVYAEGLKVYIKDNKKFKKMIVVNLDQLKEKEGSVILSKTGASIFTKGEDDLKISTIYRGGFQFDLKAIGKNTLLGSYKPNQKLLSNINLGRNFWIEKNESKAKCHLVCRLPESGILLSYERKK